MQLVESGPAAKAQFLLQHFVREDGHNRPAYDEDLFDLPLIGPRDYIAPSNDVLRRDHSSISGAHDDVPTGVALNRLGREIGIAAFLAVELSPGR